VSMICGAIWLNEHLTPRLLFGSALTIFGVVLVIVVTSRSAPTGFDEAPEQ